MPEYLEALDQRGGPWTVRLSTSTHGNHWGRRIIVAAGRNDKPCSPQNTHLETNFPCSKSLAPIFVSQQKSVFSGIIDPRNNNNNNNNLF